VSTIFIETPRLVLRQWTETDHEPFIELNLDRDVMEFFPSTLTREESMGQIARITTHINQYGYGLFAVERKDNHQFIGFTGLSHPQFESYFTPCVEIGWRLSKENWNQGFAIEAAKACLKWGLQTLKLSEIYSFTSIHNLRSEQVMIKIGMHKMDLFEHPMIKEGHFLKQHVLYKTSPLAHTYDI
jgi:RimJ/RimL family protein N-acetyltransferase